MLPCINSQVDGDPWKNKVSGFSVIPTRQGIAEWLIELCLLLREEIQGETVVYPADGDLSKKEVIDSSTKLFKQRIEEGKNETILD